jgi:hypothetical protein
MSPHAPPHIKDIAPVLMAGENVRWIGKPSPMLMGILDLMMTGAAFIPLVLFFMIFAADFPMALKITFALLAGIAGAGILHMTIGTRKYVITDQRLLIIANLSSDVHDSCELRDITGVLRPKFLRVTRSLFIERGTGKPIRLWALSEPEAVIDALNIGQLTADTPKGAIEEDGGAEAQ